MFNISTILCYSVINLVVLINVELEIPSMAMSMCLLPFWLLLMIYVLLQNSFLLHVVKHGLNLLWLRDITLLQWHRPKLRTGSRYIKARHFRRRRLPFHVVLRCKDCPLKENG